MKIVHVVSGEVIETFRVGQTHHTTTQCILNMVLNDIMGRTNTLYNWSANPFVTLLKYWRTPVPGKVSFEVAEVPDNDSIVSDGIEYSLPMADAISKAPTISYLRLYIGKYLPGEMRTLFRKHGLNLNDYTTEFIPYEDKEVVLSEPPTNIKSFVIVASVLTTMFLAYTVPNFLEDFDKYDKIVNKLLKNNKWFEQFSVYEINNGMVDMASKILHEVHGDAIPFYSYDYAKALPVIFDSHADRNLMMAKLAKDLCEEAGVISGKTMYTPISTIVNNTDFVMYDGYTGGYTDMRILESIFGTATEMSPSEIYAYLKARPDVLETCVDDNVLYNDEEIKALCELVGFPINFIDDIAEEHGLQTADEIKRFIGNTSNWKT